MKLFSIYNFISWDRSISSNQLKVSTPNKKPTLLGNIRKQKKKTNKQIMRLKFGLLQ